MTDAKSFWEDDIPEKPVCVKAVPAPKAATVPEPPKARSYIRRWENPDLVSPSQLQLRALCGDHWMRGSVFRYDVKEGESINDRYRQLVAESSVGR